MYVAAALEPYGWALSSGDYGGVGVGGLATAGGIGWLARKHDAPRYADAQRTIEADDQAGTVQAISTMATTFRPARIQNSGRQPIRGNSHCTGNVEASIPSEPVMSIQELARNCVAEANHRRKPVRGAIRQALTPMPVRMRAISKSLNFVASAAR